jgi:putative heme-binding domain-containing protein
VCFTKYVMLGVDVLGVFLLGVFVLSGATAPVLAQSTADGDGSPSGTDISVPSPWSEQQPQVMQATTELDAASAASREAFLLQPGFQVELLYTVPKDTHGSWVSLALDPQGRILASDQDKLGLSRITPSPIGSKEPTRVEKLALPVTAAQGMLYAFDSLYLSINGGPGSGFYRAQDTDGDGEMDDVQKLMEFRGGGEHGPHAIRLSPDGKSLYVVCGNHTDPPDFSASRILPAWGEDLLLPRQWDARGHAAGRLAPGGWIVRTDPDGKQWEMVSIGYRNAYDFAFNPDGEMFAYDADMEWDLGTPWYRPTRLVHATSGSEFGWRSGTGKWPAYYMDSLPAVVDIGPGSPVGVEFGTGAKFPAKYQRALYLLDWTFGTMYAVHFTPDGASYSGEKEEFVSRVALPLTDAVVGQDGALYFAVGGRGTDSALYRVTYVGDESTAADSGHDEAGEELRALRRRVELAHPRLENPTPEADVDFLWEQIGHEDRFIRYAARVAIERQPLDAWQARALNAPDATRRMEGAAALARAGSAQLADDAHAAEREKLKQAAIASLNQLPFDSLSHTQKLNLLRAYSLVFIRLGQPTVGEAAAVTAQLDPAFPSENEELDRELANVLVYLNAPAVVQKSLELMARDYTLPPDATEALLSRNPGYGRTIADMLANRPELQKLHLAFALRNMRYGWTLEERRQYLDWLNQAKQRSGGASYEGFIDNIRKDALANLSDAERAALESDVLTPPPVTEELPKPMGPGHAWTSAEVVQLVSEKLSERNFESGKRSFAAARCVVCHRFDGAGGATGPDLTSVAGRFSVKDLSEALIEPSKVVSDQYRASVIETKDGMVITGRIVNESESGYTVQTNPEDATQLAMIEKSNVETLEPSGTSLMPAKLLDVLNEQEVLDLFAYLLSRGNPQDLMFQPKTQR